MSDYFNETLASGLSGDDVNRRLREKRLGFGEPSPDWAECSREIRCIYGGEHVTKADTLSPAGPHFYRKPATFLGLPVVESHCKNTEDVYGPGLKTPEDRAYAARVKAILDSMFEVELIDYHGLYKKDLS
jgi:hypothetical protein